MPLPKLQLMIPQEGYAVADDSDAILRAKLGAGPSRQRLDMIGAAVYVDMTMVLEASEYQYWRAFYRTKLTEGVTPFLIDLIVDNPVMTEHEAKIVPGSYKLQGIQGQAYLIGMQLEVRSIPADTAFDESLMALYEIYGPLADDVLLALESLVNFDLPHVVP